jgi:hypothetical protein
MSIDIQSFRHICVWREGWHMGANGCVDQWELAIELMISGSRVRCPVADNVGFSLNASECGKCD